ncbi:hypothetical protein CDAR_7691 [Caerostris darwini]|uniref:Uncharacterized protein n=1 Tax=Caerostris darwini TaxID=1538125 RepID=A0AAV4RAD7_9ARAC|nr:hypothetical protein CDAR_7691 [Caerostris darwini]
MWYTKILGLIIFHPTIQRHPPLKNEIRCLVHYCLPLHNFFFPSLNIVFPPIQREKKIWQKMPHLAYFLEVGTCRTPPTPSPREGEERKSPPRVKGSHKQPTPQRFT